MENTWTRAASSRPQARRAVQDTCRRGLAAGPGAAPGFVMAQHSGSAGAGGGTGDGTGTEHQHLVKFCPFPCPLQPQVPQLCARSVTQHQRGQGAHHCPVARRELEGLWGPHRVLGHLQEPRSAPCKPRHPVPAPSRASVLNGEDLPPPSPAAHLPPTPPGTRDAVIAAALSPQGLPRCHPMAPDPGGDGRAGHRRGSSHQPPHATDGSTGTVARGEAASSAEAFPG